MSNNRHFFSRTFHDNAFTSNCSSPVKLTTKSRDSVAEERALETMVENFEIRQGCIFTIIWCYIRIILWYPTDKSFRLDDYKQSFRFSFFLKTCLDIFKLLGTEFSWDMQLLIPMKLLFLFNLFLILVEQLASLHFSGHSFSISS